MLLASAYPDIVRCRLVSTEYQGCSLQRLLAQVLELASELVLVLLVVLVLVVPLPSS